MVEWRGHTRQNLCARFHGVQDPRRSPFLRHSGQRAISWVGPAVTKQTTEIPPLPWGNTEGGGVPKEWPKRPNEIAFVPGTGDCRRRASRPLPGVRQRGHQDAGCLSRFPLPVKSLAHLSGMTTWGEDNGVCSLSRGSSDHGLVELQGPSGREGLCEPDSEWVCASERVSVHWQAGECLSAC